MSLGCRPDHRVAQLRAHGVLRSKDGHLKCRKQRERSSERGSTGGRCAARLAAVKITNIRRDAARSTLPKRWLLCRHRATVSSLLEDGAAIVGRIFSRRAVDGVQSHGEVQSARFRGGQRRTRRKVNRSGRRSGSQARARTRAGSPDGADTARLCNHSLTFRALSPSTRLFDSPSSSSPDDRALLFLTLSRPLAVAPSTRRTTPALPHAASPTSRALHAPLSVSMSAQNPVRPFRTTSDARPHPPSSLAD